MLAAPIIHSAEDTPHQLTQIAAHQIQIQIQTNTNTAYHSLSRGYTSSRVITQLSANAHYSSDPKKCEREYLRSTKTKYKYNCRYKHITKAHNLKVGASEMGGGLLGQLRARAIHLR